MGVFRALLAQSAGTGAKALACHAGGSHADTTTALPTWLEACRHVPPPTEGDRGWVLGRQFQLNLCFFERKLPTYPPLNPLQGGDFFARTCFFRKRKVAEIAKYAEYFSLLTLRLCV